MILSHGPKPKSQVSRLFAISFDFSRQLLAMSCASESESVSCSLIALSLAKSQSISMLTNFKIMLGLGLVFMNKVHVCHLSRSPWSQVHNDNGNTVIHNAQNSNWQPTRLQQCFDGAFLGHHGHGMAGIEFLKLW